MGIEFVYLLGKKSDAVIWFECWKQHMLRKAAEAFSKEATVIFDKKNWKDIQARMEVARALCRKDRWFRLTSKL
jgi:hypothetical protein